MCLQLPKVNSTDDRSRRKYSVASAISGSLMYGELSMWRGGLRDKDLPLGHAGILTAIIHG
jgi:hypothetical protein